MESTSHESGQADADADAEEDIVDLCRKLDTELEEKAKMHNLNALNVKSILHRLIKDPHVLTTLMGIKGDTDDIPSVKVTRSKVKHCASEAAKVELKPVPPPRTFLDVQFEDEDDDEDYRPEDVNSEESDDEEQGNETATINPDQIREGEMEGNAVVQPMNVIDSFQVAEQGDTEAPPYQLRSRVPHVDDKYTYGSLNTSFTQDSFDTFVDYHGQEMLTFVENPDYLSFLQGIHASSSTHENGSTPVDDDDPDDEEYNVLTELEGLKELERDKDELRMDRFTEIPMREVEGLFLDLLGEDVEAIRPELMLQKVPSPNKKRPKQRSGEMRKNKRFKDDPKVVLPVDNPPPDGSYSASLISGRPIEFKPEELEQLRIQLEQHVQLLTQSVVMCYHDERLAHVKNQYQLMINELDSRYYAGGESSVFNISNLGGAIESCHDIMGITRVEQAHVKWDPTPFGWSPRPEATLVLGRSQAIIYPDLLPGVQPDLFDTPHQFFTDGEDLLLAHALIQFRHVPHSNAKDPFGRLYWVQRMLLPCKTVPQIRSHIRVARQHMEGQVNQRNPLYQIIIQALRGVCHLRFPFEKPRARYEPLQMWPEEERPIWYNKFLKKFTTFGPTVVTPYVPVNERTPPELSATVMSVSTVSKKVSPMVTFPKQPNSITSSYTVSYEVNVNFHREDVHLATGVDALPYSFYYESVSASFPQIWDTVTTAEEQSISPFPDASVVKLPPHVAVNVKDESQVLSRQKSLNCPPSNSEDPAVIVVDAESNVSPLLPDTPCSAASFSLVEPHFSVFEPNKEFFTMPTIHYQELRMPKSEFSLDGESNEDTPATEDQFESSSEKTSRNRARIERGRFVPYKKRATRDSKSVPTTTVKCKKDCDKTSTQRSKDIPSNISESVSQRFSRRQNVHHCQNEVQKVEKGCPSKQRPSNSEWDTVECVRKKIRKTQNPLIEEKLRKNNDRDVSCEASKGDYTSEYVGRRIEDKRDVLLNHRGTVQKAMNGKESAVHSDLQIQQSSMHRDEKVYEASCNTVTTLFAPNRSESACHVVAMKSKDFTMLERDVVTELIVETENSRESNDGVDDGLLQSSRSTHLTDAEICAMESPAKTWKDCDYTNDEYDNDQLTLQSDMGTDPMMREFDSEYIPKTPTFNTPSDYSPIGSVCHLSISRTPSPGCDLGIPVTPRDDVVTRSPTLLRAPSAVSKALFSKIQIKRLSTDKVDLANNEPSSNCLRDTWDCVDDYSVRYCNAGPSTELDGGDQNNDDSEDAPGSEMYSAGDELDVCSKTRMKRRTRTEKERMGFERMQNPHHRARQMISLARKIAVDIKQRTFMHQDVWQTVKRIVLGKDTMEAQFDRLKAALLPKHVDVLVLLSLLADESALPPELLTSPLRRAYHGAVEMLLAIEAYCHGTRSRSSNTRSLLKTIGSMGQTLSELEFCDRLADLLGNERPLWNYIRQWLPLTYDEKVTSADFEFVDLCRRTDSELIEDRGAECIDDLNAVLGAQPPRKGGSLQVHAGQLNCLQNGVYVPILVSKADARNEQPEAVDSECNEVTWTKEVDMLILNTYNDIDGSNEDVVNELVRRIPYSFENIERRLNFLISLF